MSANQPSIYGAVEYMYTEVSEDIMASRKTETHATQDLLETFEIPTKPSTADPRTDLVF